MVRDKQDSSRDLLDQIEGAWDSPKPGKVGAGAAEDDFEPIPSSSPNLDDLDSAWGEDAEDAALDAADKREEEADAAPLPDERLDPVAYAAAKRAREERAEARRERRRVRLEAKKARRKTRADAQKAKQKGKQKKAAPKRPPARPSKDARDKVRRAATKPALEPAESSSEPDETAEAADARGDGSGRGVSGLISLARASLFPSEGGRLSSRARTNAWMLAMALVIFVAAAAFAAVVAR